MLNAIQKGVHTAWVTRLQREVQLGYPENRSRGKYKIGPNMEPGGTPQKMVVEEGAQDHGRS